MAEGNTPGAGASAGLERVQRLTVYIKETDHVEHRPLYLRILELVKNSGTAGATVLRGVAGYSISSRSIRSAGFADLQQKLPLLVVIVDRAVQLETLLPQITAWVQVNGGMVTLEDLQGHHFLHPDKGPRDGHA
jgi:PII-like signaling protein